MEWQVIIAIILTVALCFLPLAMAWRFYSKEGKAYFSHKGSNEVDQEPGRPVWPM